MFSGHISVDTKSQMAVLDNIRSGYDLWDLTKDEFVQTFPTGKPDRHLPRQVVFADKSKTVVGGSDHGVVYVFDRKTGAPLDVLHQGQRGLVQTVAVRSTALF